MKNRLLWLPAVPGAALATMFPDAAAAATLRPGSDFTVSMFNGRATPSFFLAPNAMPAARRFSPSRLLDDSAVRGQTGMDLFARRLHFQRFRLMGINGNAPFPMAAFELGSRSRFFGNRLAVNAGVFRYRYGGYRLTLPVARGSSGVAGSLPSLGMSSRTSGAELQVGYHFSSRDYAGVSASYVRARRSSLPTLAVASTQVTNIRSFQVVPSYEHVLPLEHGRSLAFDAAAIYRSSVRVTDAIPAFDTSIRKIETTRFDASLTYRANPRLSVAAFVRNITDVRPDRSTPLTTRNVVNPSTASAVLSEPRTVGLILNARL